MLTKQTKYFIMSFIHYYLLQHIDVSIFRYIVRILYGDAQYESLNTISINGQTVISQASVPPGEPQKTMALVNVDDEHLVITASPTGASDLDCNTLSSVNKKYATRLNAVELHPIDPIYVDCDEFLLVGGSLSSGRQLRILGKERAKSGIMQPTYPAPTVVPDAIFTIFGSLAAIPKHPKGDRSVAQVDTVTRTFYNWAHIGANVSALIISV